MNETEAGASVTGWSRSEAPKTRPASMRISSSRLSSGNDCAPAETAVAIISANVVNVVGEMGFLSHVNVPVTRV